MKTTSELQEDILKITTTIRNTFPELEKYITEMPVTIPDKQTPEIDTRALQDYLNSLKNLLVTYSKNHQPSK